MNSLVLAIIDDVLKRFTPSPPKFLGSIANEITNKTINVKARSFFLSKTNRINIETKKAIKEALEYVKNNGGIMYKNPRI